MLIGFVSHKTAQNIKRKKSISEHHSHVSSGKTDLLHLKYCNLQIRKLFKNSIKDLATFCHNTLKCLCRNGIKSCAISMLPQPLAEVCKIFPTLWGSFLLIVTSNGSKEILL